MFAKQIYGLSDGIVGLKVVLLVNIYLCIFGVDVGHHHTFLMVAFNVIDTYFLPLEGFL
jgi:hypothetical protein